MPHPWHWRHHHVHRRFSLTWIIVLAVALLLALITVLMQFAMPKFRIMQKLVDRLNLVSREI